MRIFFLILGFAILLMGGVWFGLRGDRDQSTVVQQPVLSIEESRVEPEKENTKPEIIPIKPEELSPISSIQYQVPFTSQAPTGDWSRSAFQDGCEEASTLMVWMARTGMKLTLEEAKTKLLDMAEFQEKIIGHGVDTDTKDTHEYLLKQYFEITDARVAYDVTLDELREAVMEGLVIVPTNGRALGNPNFTLPGPLQHMLVITGYDMATQEFITNDPGTRKGEGYRYPEQVLYAAIREYPTGKHLAIETSRKAMIVVPFQATNNLQPITNNESKL